MSNDESSKRLWLIVSCLILAGFTFIIYPKLAWAEIATTRDWIGLFTAEAGDAKTDTVNGNSWKYTSNCAQTTPVPGTAPKLEYQTGCQFTINPTPLPGDYKFRLYANNQETHDALIAESKTISQGVASLVSPNLLCPGGTHPIRTDTNLLTFADETENGRFSTSGVCIFGPRASIPQFSIPTYEEMKLTYYIKAKEISGVLAKYELTGNQIQDSASSPIDLSTTTNQLYHITGNLTLNNNIALTTTGVVFVDGDLSINTDLTHSVLDAGLVFVVEGNVYIHQDVGEVDAIIVAHNEFCSAADDLHNCDNTTNNQLTIKGSIIFLNNSATPVSPQFVRSFGTNAGPAEKIIFQPKYLVILKDIFARDLTIWKEIE